MRFKLIYERNGTARDDIVVTADATATIGDLAEAIHSADPVATRDETEQRATTRTLRVHSDAAAGMGVRLMPAELPVAEAGLRSGARVSIALQATRSTDPSAPLGDVAAVVRILVGPEAGREFTLAPGSTYVGRDPTCRVRLSDPLISRRHARINVSDAVEVVDANSANGVTVAGGLVARAVVTSNDIVTMGDTSMSISLVRGRPSMDESSVEMNRSPRLDPHFAGDRFELPEPPTLHEPQPLPVLALLAPLIAGGVMFAFTRSALSIVFVALSPLLLVATYADGRRQARRRTREAERRFDGALRAVSEKLVESGAAQVAMRLHEAPATADVVNAAMRRAPLLWTRRPEHDAFATVRLGVGSAPSRNDIVMPSGQRADASHVARLDAIRLAYSTVEPVPIVGDFRRSGAIGIAGSSDVALGAARAVLINLVGLHSPAELVLTAITSADGMAEWDWIKWLPHAGSPASPIGPNALAADPAAATSLVAALEGVVEQRLAARSSATSEERGRQESPDSPRGAPAIPSLVLFVTDDALVDRSRLVWLAEHGVDASVYVLWLAPSVQRIPAACRTYLDIDGATSAGTVGYVRAGLQTTPVRVETVASDVAMAFARSLAPVVDSGARLSDESDLPREVSYLALAGAELSTDPTSIIERWRESGSLDALEAGAGRRRRSVRSLRALIGQSADGPFSIDLRAQGPHALVGGTTGAGKSEFLQTWVLGMAASHSPLQVTFLFVDYKGGAAFADCVQLPHTVGLVTDLSPALVRRALQSLKAELHHREELLNLHHAKDLLDLEQKSPSVAPPSLVIVVDEFAALATEVPAFVDGVIDVAQRGRSLGLHLVLATQRPAGVITGSLRANTNLRVALRLNDSDDSVDILDDPVAAGFDPSVPGRAAIRTGPGRITHFQAAYAGGRTASEPPRPRIEVAELSFGAPREWIPPEDPDEVLRVADAHKSPTDIARAVDVISRAAQKVPVPAPRKPWLPVLDSTYNWSELYQRTDEALHFGWRDRPREQTQDECVFRPDDVGHMAVYGTGGSGKSTVLRTIALSAGVHKRGGPVHVYCLDFGSGGLRMLEGLPHVGAVVTGDDEERVIRLLRMLRDTVAERANRYAQTNSSSVTAYREHSGEKQEPRILVLIDGMANFRNEYEFESGRTAWFNVVTQLMTDGRAVGVHVVMTADRPSTIPAAIASGIQSRLVLRLASEDDYALIGVPKDVLDAQSPPGRGILDGDEVQVAVIGGTASTADQARKIVDLGVYLRRAGVGAAPPVARLPERVPLRSLPPWAPPRRRDEDPRMVFAMADEDLGPDGAAPAGTFLVSGPPSSGRTTVLMTLAAAVRRARSADSLYYIGTSRSAVFRASWWAERAGTPEDTVAVCAAIKARLETATTDASLPDLAVFVEGAASFAGTAAESALADLVAVCTVRNVFLVAESETATWGQYSPFLSALKLARRGIALQPDQIDGDKVFSTSFGRMSRNEFALGRGLLVEGGRYRRAQVALAE